MTDPNTGLLALALEAARRAGDFLRDGRPADLAVAATKTSAIDVVTEMDIASEKMITGFLADRRPEDGFLGEEGASTEGTSGVRWIIDPLDGTVNYLYGRPAWAVSIAAERDGVTVVGVVHAPMRGETCRAVLGGGAHLDDTPIQVNTAPTLDRALVGTGFGYLAGSQGPPGRRRRPDHPRGPRHPPGRLRRDRPVRRRHRPPRRVLRARPQPLGLRGRGTDRPRGRLPSPADAPEPWPPPN